MPACAAILRDRMGNAVRASTTPGTVSMAGSPNMSSLRPLLRRGTGTDFAKIAPILCAGLKTYKGLKEAEARPGEWVVISGVGGLGHVAIQYAKAMGLKVVAIDIAADKLKLAPATGADLAVNALAENAVKQVPGHNGRRCAWRPGDGRLHRRVRASAEAGAAKGHYQPRWTSARRISNANLRRCT
jgi:D-arabinose 1-dehydrogenase-like Zn-dependent alcohol dehydrogenase